jgi:hypothetical protein
VRILSGCASLDCQWDSRGRALSTPPVERRRLELAKRNIEERFVVAAPMERITALIWFFKRLYNWQVRLALFTKLNESEQSGRPTVDSVCANTRNRLKQINQFDTELYEWVKEHFADQIKPLEPDLSREVRRFEQLNEYMQRINRALPSFLVKAAKRSVYRRPRALALRRGPANDLNPATVIAAQND